MDIQYPQNTKKAHKLKTYLNNTHQNLHNDLKKNEGEVGKQNCSLSRKSGKTGQLCKGAEMKADEAKEHEQHMIALEVNALKLRSKPSESHLKGNKTSTNKCKKRETNTVAKSEIAQCRQSTSFGSTIQPSQS